eukprot:GILJ01006778.1.p1 GENE.GILJ01006778.1~~GILJ01006778.1.p1  ORF type:complete len:707 (+),score=95.89 GILJ01006778.1:27-2123(+)
MAKPAAVVPELVEERATASFNPRLVTFMLDGGQEKTERKEYLRSLVINDPIFSKDDIHFIDRTERFKRIYQKLQRLQEITLRENITDPQEIFTLKETMDDVQPLALHFGMFLPTLMGQGTEEQASFWVPLAYSLQIIGCYAQTEMGHGSFIRGFETTATYDEQTKEFIIHSPTVTATKWWPGGLGKTANYCVTQAKLIIKGTDYGVHTFIVPLRDVTSHEPLPGIDIGDIGPKIGYHTQDNGFLRFDNVRIPRDHMLMRFAQVSESGEYSRPPHAKLGYGTMIMVRAYLVRAAGDALSRAVTIATRYSCVRRQFLIDEKNSNSLERKIIDYQMQQKKLFPLIAAAYAFMFSGKALIGMVEQLQQDIKAGDLGILPELHALSAGLKATATTIASEGIETCRLACGGHGYSLASGLPGLFADYAPNPTFEGDNTVLLQQTARFIIKRVLGLRKIKKGDKKGDKKDKNSDKTKHLAGSTYLDYLPLLLMNFAQSKSPVTTPESWFDMDTQLNAWRHRVAVRVGIGAQKLQKAITEGKQTFEDAWNTTAQIEICNLATAHSLYVLVRNFFAHVASMPDVTEEEQRVKQVMGRLADVFSLFHLANGATELIGINYCTGAQIMDLRTAFELRLKHIRPDAVGLVDSFNHSDHLLNSCLGRYDGNVYTALFDWAKKSPLNSTHVIPGIKEHLQPMVAQLKKLSKL